MSYLAHMDEDEAVRLAHATLMFVAEDPMLVHTSPILVIAEVLTKPPWSLGWRDAVLLVGTALRQPERKTNDARATDER